jgi:3-hydroxyacyl-CoA dehydrogenase
MMKIRKAAVLGAGLMGTTVAAHLANAGIPTLVLDLAPTDTAANSLKALAKARPAPLAHPSRQALLTPGNFDDDLAKLADVDWVIEAVVEDPGVKTALFARVAEHLNDRAIITSNSSGLSMNAMADALPEGLQPRFFGAHFFNPPRYMYLLEVIPTRYTDPRLVEGFADFAALRLGKGVVRCNDAAMFVANRVGMFTTVHAMNKMGEFGLTVEEADAASGRAIGRAVTATFGTADLAGSDILAHNVATHRESATDDEMLELWQLPDWVLRLIEKGCTGNKTGSGFYKDRRAMTIDPATLEYRPFQKPEQPSLVGAAKMGDPVERVKTTIAAEDPAGRFAWEIVAGTLLYAANRIPEICDDITAIDDAMRWGYAWDFGPFGLWDALGVPETVERMKADGRAIPEWVAQLAASDSPFFYEKSDGRTAIWGPSQSEHKALAPRPRTLSLSGRKATGHTLAENEHASLIDLGDRVACIEFHTKANVVSEPVLAFIEEAIELAGAEYDALVIGNQGAHFSGGADLKMMVGKIEAEDWGGIDATLKSAQRASMAIKYSPVPVVAAPFGRVLGGGLEVCLHCARVQAHTDVAMGLVETGVGLVPAAGGIKESLLRAMAAHAGEAILFPVLRRPFEAITMAKVSRSALDAADMGFVRPGDGITMNRDSVVYAAKQVARSLADTGWQPPVPATVAVQGRDGLANFHKLLHIVRGGEFISDHDLFLSDAVAFVLCGGDVDPGTIVDEQYLLDLERQAFLKVCRTPKTMERLQAMLTTGKPLRN